MKTTTSTAMMPTLPGKKPPHRICGRQLQGFADGEFCNCMRRRSGCDLGPRSRHRIKRAASASRVCPPGSTYRVSVAVVDKDEGGGKFLLPQGPDVLSGDNDVVDSHFA